MKRLFKVIRAYFPSALPNGLSAFNTWADSFSDTYEMPTADQDSIRWALSTTIMHLGPQVAYKSKFYFFLTIKAGAAKQVASQAFTTIKETQQLKETEAKLVQQTVNGSTATN